ncbi:phage holin family protein [Bradyrhizobium jicamae]|uniref:phage holin family protein n=1 Tax=Bradyrhizobium jicamae TaxID=280332 RepID=UPI003221532E
MLRAGMELKLNQIKLATLSYLRDRTGQATSTITSYAIAAGLFAAAGIFMIAACLVGITALFRWIEIHYGQFWAFGAVGALLAMIATICAGLAVVKLRQKTPHFPSLASRLRVAVKAGPLKPDQIGAARDTARSILQAPPASPASSRRSPSRDSRPLQAGVILMATLLGLAVTRRRRQARQMDI